MASAIAESALKTSVFVTYLGAAADGQVLPVSTGGLPHGITQDYPKGPPIDGNNADLAAAAGDPVMVLDGRGEFQNRETRLRITGTVARGAMIMPDATGDGSGITCTAGKYYGAIALESGTSGQTIRVTPAFGLMVPA